MKPSDAIGMVVYSRRFGVSKVISHQQGLMFLLESQEKFPGVEFTASWRSLRKLKSSD